jgi:hypothetical protein
MKLSGKSCLASSHQKIVSADDQLTRKFSKIQIRTKIEKKNRHFLSNNANEPTRF